MSVDWRPTDVAIVTVKCGFFLRIRFRTRTSLFCFLELLIVPKVTVQPSRGNESGVTKFTTDGA